MIKSILIFAFLGLPWNSLLCQTGTPQVPPLVWEVGYHQDHQSGPLKWIPAVVPGAVQLDIARAEKYDTWFFGENWKDYEWMEDQYFTYRTFFEKPVLKSGERLWFYSGGIDYRFDVLLNGAKLLEQEGMFTPVNIDLTAMLRERNELSVVIHPIPKSVPFPADRSQANRSVKPAVSYGWDWHPRLVPSGIWEETGLRIEPAGVFSEIEVTYTLTDSLDRASVQLVAGGKGLQGLRYRWTLVDPGGQVVADREGELESDRLRLESGITSPALWWPHDHGKQNLYTWRMQLIDLQGSVVQVRESVMGFRRVRLVTNRGVSDPPGYPKSRMYPPFQLEINGRRIFGKGTNWVNPEVFPGILTAGRYAELIDRAVEANFNFFRIWGGGIVNKESFFEACDRKGVMVWQEFPLSCNNYPDDPHYLSILEQESESIIKRLRNHPSVVLWCGGNELFNTWGGMTDQSLALRLLNSQCLKLDPFTPFIPTSPIEGVKHGHYVFQEQSSGIDVFERMAGARATAYTEFGIPAPASVEILKSIIPAGELWPPKPGTSWQSHHAYHAWGANTWLMQDMIEGYFGRMNTLEDLVYYGQLLQGEGYKCIYETARRQKPYCSMALNWCYNEPWPTAANNSIVSYPNIPKPGFYGVRDACRPVLASAAIGKFTWKAGERFTTSLWMLNDRFEGIGVGKMRVRIVAGDRQVEMGAWEFSDLEPNTNLEGPELSVVLPKIRPGIFRLILEVDGHPEWGSEYLLLVTE